MNWRASGLRLSVGHRLALGFATLVLMLLAVAAFNAFEFRNMEQRLREIVEVNNRKGTLAYRMLGSIDEMAIRVRSIALADVRDIQAQLDALNKAKAAYEQAQAALGEKLRDHGSTRQEQQLLKDLSEAAHKTLPWILRAAKEGEEGANQEATTTLTMQVQPHEKLWREKVAELVVAEERLTAQAYSGALQAQRRAFGVAGAVVVLAVLAGALLGWRITRSVKVPIDQAIRVAECVAQGDLTSSVEVRSADEIGRLLAAISTMQDRLRALVGEIRESAQSIHVASSEVATGNQDLSHRTELAASRLQQTASSMDQLAATVQQSAQAADNANRLASSASAVASRGGAAVDDVVRKMGEIDRSSKKIADIIGVIDGIAFQTNILALNAAVEAARAGEQGRGFAVVAGEVRSLAQRSAGAAKEIKQLIGESQAAVEEGARLVVAAGSTMGEVVSSVHGVSSVMEGITVASKEQSGGIGDINRSITELDRMTQQNAALVEQSAAAAESLREQASRLARTVETFRLQGDGQETQTLLAPPAVTAADAVQGV